MAPTDFLACLDECVATTESCAQSLSSTISFLQPGIAELPRLGKVLRNQHVHRFAADTTDGIALFGPSAAHCSRSQVPSLPGSRSADR